MKSITDDEVDLLMQSSASASEIYLMKHFRHDIMNSTKDKATLELWDVMLKNFKDDNITDSIKTDQYVI